MNSAKYGSTFSVARSTQKSPTATPLKSATLVSPDGDEYQDEIYIDYLFDILRKQAGEKELTIEWTYRDDNYVVAHVVLPSFDATDTQLQQLFMPVHEKNIPFLICREIVRQHGEATNRHACGIYAERDNNHIVNINIILPRICKTLK